METRWTHTLLSATLALALVGSACGDTSDEKKDGAAGATSTAPGATSTGDKTLAVTGADYEFKGVPKTVAAGTVVSFKNSSTKEVHEIVALRVKDGETRPMSDLLALPEAESEKVAEFRGVMIAYPGEAGIAPQGPLTLSQPGRYMLVCFIPTGADPAAYKAALAANTGSGPPPSVPGGPPHIAKGMASEVTVT